MIAGTKSWRTDLTGIWSSRPDVIIHAVAQDIEGRIWVGKDYDGIDVLEKETGKVTSLVAHDDNGRSLPHNTIYDLYADRDGVMWVGTYKKGVSYYSESIFKFNMYEWGDITCIEQADEDRLWLGTNDHGILLWNRSTGKAEPFWRDARRTIAESRRVYVEIERRQIMGRDIQWGLVLYEWFPGTFL